MSLPSSSEPESIALHDDPTTVRLAAEADVDALGGGYCADVAETCVDAVEGAWEVMDIADEAEATDGLRRRRDELAVLLDVDGVRGSLRDGARPEEGPASATEVSIRRWDVGSGIAAAGSV